MCRLGATAAAACFAVAALVYAATPLWFPTGWLAARIAQDLTAQLGRPVAIRGLELGWISGIQIRDLTVAATPRDPSHPLLVVRRAWLAFEPIRLLFTQTSRELRIDGIEARLQLDAQGRILNLPVLRNAGRKGLTFLRYSANSLMCHIDSPIARQIVRLDRVACRIDPDTGIFSMQAAAIRPHASRDRGSTSRFMIDAQVTLARIRHDKRLGGSVRIDWRNLALGDLPLALVPQLPLHSAGGHTSGELNLRPHPDLSMGFDLHIDLNGVSRVNETGEVTGRRIDAAFETSGQWDPATDRVQLSALSYQTKALHVHGPANAPALSMDLTGPAPFQLRLAGQVRDWAALDHELPELAAALETTHAHLAGGADCRFEIDHQPHEDRITLAIDARQARCLVKKPGQAHVELPAGVEKSLHIDVLRTRERRSLIRSVIRCQVADASIDLQAEVSWSPSKALRAPWAMLDWPQLAGRFEISAEDLRQLVDYLPGLAGLGNIDDARGPMRITGQLEPLGDRSRVRLNLNTSSRTEVTAGEWLRVRPGQPVALVLDLDWAHAGSGADLQLRAEVGDLEVEIPRARLICRFALDQPGGDVAGMLDGIRIHAALQAPVQISRVEAFAQVFPQWAARIAPLTAAGGLDLEGRLEFTRAPGEFILSSQLDVLADALELRYHNHPRKPAGQPLHVSARHRLAATPHGREQSARFELRCEPVRIAGNIAFAGLESRDLSDDFEQLHLMIDVDDADEALRLVPELREHLRNLQVHGRWRFELEELLAGADQRVTLRCDATHTELFVDGERPFHKHAGTPAVCELAWTGEPGPDGTSESWSLSHGRIELGGWRTSDLSGQVVMATTGRPALLARSRFGWGASRGERVLRSARLHSGGLVRFDRSLAFMHERLARAFDEYHLSGECAYQIDLEASSKEVGVSGTISAERAGFSIELDHPRFPMFRKAAGAPADAVFALHATREDDGAIRIDVPAVDLSLPGAHASLDGVVLLAARSGRLEVDDMDLTARTHLLEPRALAALFPASELRLRAGACTASARLFARDGQITLDGIHVDLTDTRIQASSESVALDGVIMTDQNRVTIDQLKGAWGSTQATLSGDVWLSERSAHGRVALAVDRLDLPDLRSRLATARTDDAQAGAAPEISDILDYLRRSDLTVSGHADSVIFNLPLDVPVTLSALTLRTLARQGAAELSFRCLVDGGLVTGQCKANLRDPQAPFHLTYTGDRIHPGRVVDQYLALTFPGMKATGPLTLIDETHQKLLPHAGELNHPVGKGEMIIAGGTIEGRAAPEWMTRIFPGLNLSSFEFGYMHSWFNKTIDGRIRHQMIYQGRFYNIYAVGHSDIAGRIDYEVGLDFLADFDSQYWAESGQGRIPLFRKTGIKAPDGTLQNEVVTFTPPERILDTLLLKNNPLVTAYHAVRKRVLREQ